MAGQRVVCGWMGGWVWLDEQENGSMNSGCERQELHPCGPKWVTATASLLPQPSCSPHQWPRRHTRAHPLPAHFCMPIATTTHSPCALTRKPDTGTHNPPASTSYTHAPSPTPTTTREPSSTPTARTAHPHTTHNNTHTHGSHSALLCGTSSSTMSRAACTINWWAHGAMSSLFSSNTHSKIGCSVPVRGGAGVSGRRGTRRSEERVCEVGGGAVVGVGVRARGGGIWSVWRGKGLCVVAAAKGWRCVRKQKAEEAWCVL